MGNNTRWYLNEDLEPYEWNRFTHSEDWPNDKATPYPTKMDAMRAADTIADIQDALSPNLWGEVYHA